MNFTSVWIVDQSAVLSWPTRQAISRSKSASCLVKYAKERGRPISLLR